MEAKSLDNKALVSPAAVPKTPLAPISQVETLAMSVAIRQAIKVTMTRATGAVAKAAAEADLPVAGANMTNLMNLTVQAVVKLDLALVARAVWMMIAMDLEADLVGLTIPLMGRIRDLVDSDLDLTTLALEIRAKMIAMDPEVADSVEDVKHASNLVMI